MAGSKKSPVSSVVIFALALLMFVAAVGIGVSMLKKPEKEDKTSSEEPSFSVSETASEDSSSDSSVEESSEEASSESESAAPSESVPAASSAVVSQSVSTSTSAPVVPASSTGVFDPSIMTDNGFSNIPNFQKINPDVKGWLKIPGTNIDYPVLHDATSHYYLDRDINKAQSRNGVIYADPAVKFGLRDQISSNSVLYGHNWTNYSANPRIGYSSDVMFAQLTSYHHLNFAKSHPYLYYSTDSEEMTWVVFAAFYTDVNFYYNIANPKTTSDFKYILDGAKARSRHVFDVPVSTSDKIITLSTCTRAYGKSDKQRFVVMAKLLPAGAELKPISVTTNPNPVLPKL